MKIFSFPPIVNKKSRVLILGTMPGADSLRLNQYYANSGNSFWKIMFSLFDSDFSSDYENRKKLLIENKVALWDVLQACVRETSMDADITNEESNDFSVFFQEYDEIQQVFFNGRKAQDSFLDNYNLPSALYQVLPSTSGAHSIPFAKKLEAWSVIFNYLK